MFLILKWAIIVVLFVFLNNLILNLLFEEEKRVKLVAGKNKKFSYQNSVEKINAEVDKR